MATDLDNLRVDQVGSLLRPPALKAIWERQQAGTASADELRHAQEEAIRAVVARQESIDFPVLTDGEFRRLNFQDSFAASVAGFEAPRPVSTTIRDNADEAVRGWNPGYAGAPAAGSLLRRPAVERIQAKRNLPLEEYRFTSSLTDRPVKVTLVSPDRIIQRFAYERSGNVYPRIEGFIDDIVAIERGMIRELVEAGCRYIQIDAPSYTAYVDPPSLQQMRERGEDPDSNLERSIQADNAVIDGFPGVTFGVHICRGNQASTWHREGRYDAIAERLFTGLNHDRFLLEYDTERAGSFEPLRFVPKGRVAVLGLISSKVGTLESADDLLRRLEAASRFIPTKQIALSPQCGFASDVGGNLLTEDDQWRKLELVRDVARRAWG
jgi:5-methyltetrahydropteroyltriglutamate--homocysteine methyltransferase